MTLSPDFIEAFRAAVVARYEIVPQIAFTNPADYGGEGRFASTIDLRWGSTPAGRFKVPLWLREDGTPEKSVAEVLAAIDGFPGAPRPIAPATGE